MSVYEPYDEVLLTEEVAFFHNADDLSEGVTLYPGDTVQISHQNSLWRWTLVVKCASEHPKSYGMDVWFDPEHVGKFGCLPEDEEHYVDYEWAKTLRKL